MKRLLSHMLAGCLLTFSSTAYAAYPLDDINTRSVDPIPEATRQLVLCAWTKDNETARRLVLQHARQVGQNKDFQYTFKRTDFSPCGGGAALQTALNDPGAVVGLLHRIWINQGARCALKSRKFDVPAIQTKLAGSPKLVPAIAGLDMRSMMALRLGEKLPNELIASVNSCDPDLASWMSSDGMNAYLFLAELSFEAKRNA